MRASVASSSCPRCGTALPADAPEGLCPRCLLRLNLAGALGGEGGDSGGEGGDPAAVPSPAEMARHFPQLEIVECLGRGGMGVVYKARQPRLDRWVALKVLAPGRETDPQFADRFAREAQALARLAHPAIVAVHDFGEADGLFYLLMEFVDGVSLRTLMREGRVPPEEALVLVPRLCEALQFAHDQGVVHRDIKPENILLDRQGRVKIADFGIAKLVGGAGVREPLTGDRGVVGTPHYMAPEQVEHPQAVDHRADIYSLGVVLYELLTGELPLGRFAAPSRRAAIDRRLDAVVLRSLEKDPSHRYQRAGEVKTELEAIAAHPEPASPGRTPEGTEAGPAAGSAGEGTAAGRPGAAAVEGNRRHVLAVAIGLYAVAFLNLLAIGAALLAAVVLVALDRRGVDLDGPLPGLVGWLQSGDRAAWWLGVGLLSVVAGSGVMILGARRMRRLESYRLALVSGALAMVLPPGNPLGVLVGFWALWVLGRRVTQQAFRENTASAGPNQRGVRSLAWVLACWILVPGLLLAGLRGWMVSPPAGMGARAATEREEAERKRLVAVAVAAAESERRDRDRDRASDATGTAGAPAGVESVPPVVVATVPMSGATGVAPGRAEIRVRFSKPMRDEGWTWGEWSPGTLPERVGEPRYLPDARTCVVDVRLEPGRTYAVWLNSNEVQDFRDRDGRPAVPYLLIFETGNAPSP